MSQEDSVSERQHTLISVVTHRLESVHKARLPHHGVNYRKIVCLVYMRRRSVFPWIPKFTHGITPRRGFFSIIGFYSLDVSR